MPAQCSHLLHQLNSCPKWWLIRDKAGTSSAVSVLQLQQICKGNLDRQVVLTFGRRWKEHHNFLISLFYLQNMEEAGEYIRVFVTLTRYKYRGMHAGIFWCFQDFKHCKNNLPPAPQPSNNLESCSAKPHDKAEHLLKSYCGSVFNILFCRRERGFELQLLLMHVFCVIFSLLKSHKKCLFYLVTGVVSGEMMTDQYNPQCQVTQQCYWMPRLGFESRFLMCLLGMGEAWSIKAAH